MSRTDRHIRRTRHRDDDLLAADATLPARLEEAAPGTVAARASGRLSFAPTLRTACW